MSSITQRQPDGAIELTTLPQWVLWRYETRDGQTTKVPCMLQGYPASVTNPDHWSSFSNATAANRSGFSDGVGFVFTADDPYCGIDLDNVWQSDADEGAPWALGILERFSDSYSEVSPSGCGVKIWCRAKAPRCGKWPVEAGAIEVYDRGRYFTFTGRHAGVLTITDHQDDVERLIGNLEGDRRATPGRRTTSSGSGIFTGTIPQGHRHNTLVSMAGCLWKRGLDATAIEAALLATNDRQCEPPYPAAHIHQIIGSMRGWSR
jgi:hypothetical protein